MNLYQETPYVVTPPIHTLIQSMFLFHFIKLFTFHFLFFFIIVDAFAYFCLQVTMMFATVSIYFLVLYSVFFLIYNSIGEYFQERQRQRERDLQSIHLIQKWPQQPQLDLVKARSQGLCSVSHLGGRGSSTCAFIYCFPRHINRKLEWKPSYRCLNQYCKRDVSFLFFY